MAPIDFNPKKKKNITYEKDSGKGFDIPYILEPRPLHRCKP